MINKEKIFSRLKTLSLAILLGVALFAVSSFSSSKQADAFFLNPCAPCAPACVATVGTCDSNCGCTSTQQTCPSLGACTPGSTIAHITDEFLKHRDWLVKTVWDNHVLPAMLLMTEQLTAAAMYQTLAIGAILDAKHQLETQSLFQKLHARAHKDYHPSEGVCKFGTNTRSLGASDRNAEFSQIVIGARGLQRGLLSGEILTASGLASNSRSRLEQFMRVYCNPKDNGNGLEKLCGSGGSDKERFNKDVDYTRTLDRPHTLTIDFSPEKTKGASKGPLADATPDAEDIFALSANLYGHEPPPQIPESYLSNKDKELFAPALTYMDIRALAAKRSVAHNSFAAIAGMKTQGEKDVQPHMKGLLKKMGIPEEEIEDMLGEKPSYYAQMEVLTKKLYQSPNFYTDLYDKPANVARKDVAMRAIGNIQKRDIYRSLLRSEAIISVWLETELMHRQSQITNETNRLNQAGTVQKIPN